MDIYICSLVVYCVGFVIAFVFFVCGDKVTGMAIHPMEILVSSFLWPVYVIVIICFEPYELLRPLIYIRNELRKSSNKKPAQGGLR